MAGPRTVGNHERYDRSIRPPRAECFLRAGLQLHQPVIIAPWGMSMTGLAELQREDEGYGSARVIGRSRLFFTTPVILMCAFLANLVWEAIRINVNARSAAEWPLRFTILNISTTVTVLVVF